MQDYKANSIIVLQGVFDSKSLEKLSIAKTSSVFVMEGRPTFQAAQETCKVLIKRGIKPTVISDNMAGFLFFKGWVKQAVLACQTADSSGALCDTGALILAVLSKKHKVSIKLLKAQHKTRFLGDPKSIAPKGVSGYVPLVEWVPAKYIK